MKKYNVLLSFLFLILSMTNCTDDFKEINKNPNAPEVASPDLLLATVLSVVPNKLARVGWGSGNIVAQLGAKNNFVSFDIYQWGSSSVWSSFYGILPEIQNIIDISTAEKTKNTTYQGIALVIKSVVFANLTDMFDKIPFSQAIKGKITGNFTPVYDDQEMVYKGILSDLKKASELLAQNQKIKGGDLIYGGNALEWQKLANSLRLRYLLRISKQNDIASQMQEIVDNDPIFTGNKDNAVLKYQGNTRTDSWFLSNSRIGSFDEYSLSATAFNFMNPLKDPRLPIWYGIPTKGTFKAAPNGLNQDNARNFDSENTVPRFNQKIFFDSATTVEAPIMKYSELQFILAEARNRGFITNGSVATYYQNGIVASMAYWGVAQANINTYISQPAVAYNGTIAQIMEQKRLADFLVGMETWYDYRRTGFPKITPGTNNVNNSKVPTRFLYPSSEQSSNRKNHDAAISSIGGNTINSKGWWEKGTRY